MNYTLIYIGSYSIILAVIIGLIRFRKIYRTYQPFIIITIAALCNEITSTLLIKSNISNAISTNILSLVECLLWFWQFKQWDGFRKGKWEFPVLVTFMVVIWSIENLIAGSIHNFNSVFSVIYSFSLVFLAINQVNRLIVEEKKNLLSNSKFLICTGAMIFYTYKIMVESFYIFKLDQSNDFLSNIYYILVFVNLFVNLLFALAILWIPTRQRFTLPS